MKKIKPMAKDVRNVFGKRIYLLGVDECGIKYWLEGATWDCNWYWGFGYIETYTNNKSPENAKDIASHQHADKFMSEFFTEWNGSKPILARTTFTEREGWELSELFEQFYFYKQSAGFWGRGKANCANTKFPEHHKPELVEEINKEILPALFKRVYEILTP